MLLALGLALGLSAAAAPPTHAPPFTLPRFDGKGPVRLADQAGRIVVLDFFAHWCGPCARSAPILEKEIQQHYARAGGNPQKVPVQVISINVEAAEKPQTAAFIRRHKPDLVVDDAEGRILDAYGGEGLPYLVVIDASRGNDGRFPIVYRRAGFEGAARLREIIDRLGVTNAPLP